MIRRHFSLILPVVLVVCAVWIGALAMINVREREYEIGILRAVGHGSGRIALLFLGKALVIGVIGALIGFAAGTALAMIYGPGIFKVTAKFLKPSYDLLLSSVIAAPAFAAISSFIPAMLAVTHDAAATLNEK
jgi:ABC-type lipoprotein release transport system permease subunit